MSPMLLELRLDRVTTGYPRLMQMHTDHFSADPFWSYEFVRLRTKGLKEVLIQYLGAYSGEDAY